MRTPMPENFGGYAPIVRSRNATVPASERRRLPSGLRELVCEEVFFRRVPAPASTADLARGWLANVPRVASTSLVVNERIAAPELEHDGAP